MGHVILYTEAEDQAIRDFSENKITESELLDTCSGRTIRAIRHRAYRTLGTAKGFCYLRDRKPRGTRMTRRLGCDFSVHWADEDKIELSRKLSGAKGHIQADELSRHFKKPVAEIAAVAEYLYGMGGVVQNLKNPPVMVNHTQSLLGCTLPTE